MAVISSRGSFRSSFPPREGKVADKVGFDAKVKAPVFFGEIPAIDSHFSGVSSFSINENIYYGNLFLFERDFVVRRTRLFFSPSSISGQGIGEEAWHLVVNWDVFIRLSRNIYLQAAGVGKGALAAEIAANYFRFERYERNSITWFKASCLSDFGRAGTVANQYRFFFNGRGYQGNNDDWVAVIDHDQIIRFVCRDDQGWDIQILFNFPDLNPILLENSVNIPEDGGDYGIKYVVDVFFELREKLRFSLGSFGGARPDLILERCLAKLPVELPVAGFFRAPENLKINIGDDVFLKREFDNSDDKNAVAVYFVDAQTTTYIRVKIGYLPRLDAVDIGVLLDCGINISAQVVGFEGVYQIRPLISIKKIG